MIRHLRERVSASVRLEEDQRWREQGIVHGFSGRDISFSTRTIAAEKSRLEAWLQSEGVTRLFLVHQEHGAESLSVPEPLLEGPLGIQFLGQGDAVILPRVAGAAGTAVGIRTADCVPILCVAPSFVAAIHAGWRGLAKGVIQKTFSRIANKGDPIRVVIGPCAGPERYEVGRDVIEALGAFGIARQTNTDKFLLDLTSTACKLIEESAVAADLEAVSATCTIQSSAFHSFRRDKEAMGSNLAWIGT